MDAKVIAAVELLNAAAKEKGEDLKKLIAEKYVHLKDVLVKAPGDFVKENPWWVAGGLALSVLAGAAVFFAVRHKKPS